MNSIKWFNKNYLFQNLKKSKGLLAVFLIIVPLLSVLSLILLSNRDGIGYTNITFNEVSIFSILGMFVIPIVISIALFGFVFKRKSSDFINSMPINRSTVFVTNSIGGILLLIAMVLITTLLVILIANFIPSIIISKAMMFDFFLIWTITYIFVFTAANFAASISGNMITQLAVTALLLFLAPFVIQTYHGFSESRTIEVKCTEKSCIPVTYNCYNDDECLENQDKGIYVNKVNYNVQNEANVPYQYASSFFLGGGKFQVYPTQTIKMVILSILYFGLGVFFFRKKRMEVTETSFSNIHLHNVVKSLTIFPMVYILMQVLGSGGIGAGAFGLIVILIYYFVFDLITRKHITHIRLSLIYFVVTIILFGGFYYITDKEEFKSYQSLSSNDIKEVSINLDASYTDTSKIYMDNEVIKNLITKNLVTTSGSYNDGTSHLTASLKLNNGKEYTFEVNGIAGDDYNKIIDAAYHNDKFTKAYKNVNYKNVYAIGTDYIVIDPAKNAEIIKMIKKGLANTNILDYNKAKEGFNLKLYAYQDHEQITYNVNSAINPELTRYISKYSNDLINNNLIKKDINIENINNISVVDGSKNNDSITDYIVNRSYNEMYNFVKNNINKTCDITKDYLELIIFYKNSRYIFYTNNTEGFEKLINDKKESLKDNLEYQAMVKQFEENESNG